MRIPLLRGRFFTDADASTSEWVTIINETTAKRYWPHEDPVGHRIRFAPRRRQHTDPRTTIVAVVGDTRHAGLDVPISAGSPRVSIHP